LSAEGRLPQVFVFYPGLNSRMWWVLAPDAAKRGFTSESLALAFARARAVFLGEQGHPLDVLQERISGSWFRVPS
jgi:hypothetical protein